MYLSRDSAEQYETKVCVLRRVGNFSLFHFNFFDNNNLISCGVTRWMCVTTDRDSGTDGRRVVIRRYGCNVNVIVSIH